MVRCVYALTGLHIGQFMISSTNRRGSECDHQRTRIGRGCGVLCRHCVYEDTSCLWEKTELDTEYYNGLFEGDGLVYENIFIMAIKLSQ